MKVFAILNRIIWKHSLQFLNLKNKLFGGYLKMTWKPHQKLLCEGKKMIESSSLTSHLELQIEEKKGKDESEDKFTKLIL